MTLLKLLEEMTSLRDTFRGSFSCVFNLVITRVILPLLKLHLAVFWSADVSSRGTINMFHGLLTTLLYVCSFVVNLSGEDSLLYLCVRAGCSFCNSVIGDFSEILALTFSITIRLRKHELLFTSSYICVLSSFIPPIEAILAPLEAVLKLARQEVNVCVLIKLPM